MVLAKDADGEDEVNGGGVIYVGKGDVGESVNKGVGRYIILYVDDLRRKREIDLRQEDSLRYKCLATLQFL